MSHSVIQKNHLKSDFMLIFGLIIAKLKSSIISKHPVDTLKKTLLRTKNESL